MPTSFSVGFHGNGRSYYIDSSAYMETLTSGVTHNADRQVWAVFPVLVFGECPSIGSRCIQTHIFGTDNTGRQVWVVLGV